MNDRFASPRVSVVIPCLNEARYLQQALDALASQEFRDFEIVLVDGGSTDDTVTIAHHWATGQPSINLHLIKNPHRQIAAGLNLGITSARGEFIARLDGHSRPAADYLQRCIAALNQPEVSVVGGALQVSPGAPGPIAAAIAKAVSTPLGAGDARYRLGSQVPGGVDTVPFGCFRREQWERLGGYNEVLAANEDYEFNLRVRLAGGQIYFDPAIRAEYFARPTLAALARQYWQYGWWKAQMLKQYPRSLRWRQAVPAAWAVGGPAALILAGLWPQLWPLSASLWVCYLAFVLMEAIRHSARNIQIGLTLAWAYMIIHFFWGWGLWLGLMAARPGRR